MGSPLPPPDRTLPNVAPIRTSNRMPTLTRLAALSGLLLSVSVSFAQDDPPTKFDQIDKFRQLEEVLPTPTAVRTASGAPGRDYWQQRADYVIDVTLDDENQRVSGTETVTYTNRSPDDLGYLWMQLDANIFKPDSDAVLTQTAPSLRRPSFRQIRSLLARQSFDGGVNISRVVDSSGQPLEFTVVKTMMRIDLDEPLAPGAELKFSVDWNYAINDARLIGGRTGYEYFEEDDNYIYEIAQWFPRMAAYNDVTGWQHKQFLGSGEFTLDLGDYLVRITVPEDHVVAASGVLLNAEEVLTSEQLERYEKARTSDELVFVVTPEEAEANESSEPEGTKTWLFKADNVRDFAWASSRKFIWDAQGHEVGGQTVMCMSFYPNEGEPLWSRYSTQSIIHTLDVYSKYTFDYPYPTAISVNGPIGGMEYPMICFNGPRPEKDGTYSSRTKYGLISVIIHEVGHNYFPMIVNSDERQWTWMDEGINTFLQYLTEQEWEPDYPSRRGEPAAIVPYMVSENQVPIMTNSESILQFGSNAYAKPATALNVLRETVLGRELFDHAFREYARRWKFKRPMPSDFFRTMEDASGIDLDWFWRGWFYTTDYVDISLEDVQVYSVDSGDPEEDSEYQRERESERPITLSQRRNRELPKRTDAFPELLDFYNEYDPLDVTESERREYERFLERLDDKDRELLELEAFFYVLEFRNLGGLVMPLIIGVTYEDDTTEEVRIPAEIWRRNNERVTKLLVLEKPVREFVLDPNRETADANTDNNIFPRRPTRSRFEMFRFNRSSNNPMQQQRREEEETEEKDDDSDDS